MLARLISVSKAWLICLLFERRRRRKTIQMEQWQDAASQQAKLLTNRLNELLSKGLEFLRSELGVDLGLKPELIPPWMILLTACTGLILMVIVWASVCRGVFKKRSAVSPVVDDGVEIKRGVSKPAKSEEPKKKKKKADKVRKWNHVVSHPPWFSLITVPLARLLAVKLTTQWQLNLVVA